MSEAIHLNRFPLIYRRKVKLGRPRKSWTESEKDLKEIVESSWTWRDTRIQNISQVAKYKPYFFKTEH